MAVTLALNDTFSRKLYVREKPRGNPMNIHHYRNTIHRGSNLLKIDNKLQTKCVIQNFFICCRACLRVNDTKGEFVDPGEVW